MKNQLFASILIVLLLGTWTLLTAHVVNSATIVPPESTDEVPIKATTAAATSTSTSTLVESKTASNIPVASTNEPTVIPLNTTTVTTTPTFTPATPMQQSVHELVRVNLPTVLARHNLTTTDTLVSLKPRIGEISLNLSECYEPGIVGKDTQLNIFHGTIEENVQYYFSKLPNLINAENAISRIHALIHSFEKVASMVTDCTTTGNDRTPIGLTPESCLVKDEIKGLDH